MDVAMVTNRQRNRASRIKFIARRERRKKDDADIKARVDRAYEVGRLDGAESVRRKQMVLNLSGDFVKIVVDNFAHQLAREALENARRSGADGEFLYIVKGIADELSQSLRGEPVRYGEIQSFVRWRMDCYDAIEFGVDLPAMRVRLMESTSRLWHTDLLSY